MDTTKNSQNLQKNYHAGIHVLIQHEAERFPFHGKEITKKTIQEIEEYNQFLDSMTAEDRDSFIFHKADKQKLH